MHEPPKLRPSKIAFLTEHDQVQIVVEGELSFLIGLEGHVVPLLHLGTVHLEGLRGSSPSVTIPAIGEQHATDIEKQRRYCRCPSHLTLGRNCRSYGRHRCHSGPA